MPEVIKAKDILTNRVLVIWSKTEGRYKPNTGIPRCESNKDHIIENYEDAKKDDFKGWICHHRLELTEDGCFLNSTMDLINKGLYYHRPPEELIWLKVGDHSRLHNLKEKSALWKGGISKKKH